MRDLQTADKFGKEQVSSQFLPKSGVIAFYLSDLKGGGVQRIVLKIAQAFADRGHTVDLVVCQPEGELASLLGDKLHLHALEPADYLASRLAAFRAAPKLAWLAPRVLFGRRYSSKTLLYLPALAEYLRKRCPSVLYAATPFLNLEAVLARRLAKASLRVVLSEHSQFSVDLPKLKRRAKVLAPAMRYAYPQADEIIAVSQGVAEDLRRVLGLPNERVKVVYNPVVGADFFRRMQEPVDHPWFQDPSVPVVVAVGRLARQKDYPTLLRAFALLRKERLARLAILGSGNDNMRARLESLVQDLGLVSEVAFLGFKPNPLPYIARAALLVLSSLREGLPTVLIESLACGTPVVSTDCLSGPAEILAGGRYGRLVPVGDPTALAKAMAETLAHPPERALLQRRAFDFDESRAIKTYEALLIG
jgi:glycosyltransferase involved in cell wall biosynthesis